MHWLGHALRWGNPLQSSVAARVKTRCVAEMGPLKHALSANSLHAAHKYQDRWCDNVTSVHVTHPGCKASAPHVEACCSSGGCCGAWWQQWLISHEALVRQHQLRGWATQALQAGLLRGQGQVPLHLTARVAALQALWVVCVWWWWWGGWVGCVDAQTGAVSM
jgi:hypothetical protein